jgi:hypothetical protein
VTDAVYSRTASERARDARVSLSSVSVIGNALRLRRLAL